MNEISQNLLLMSYLSIPSLLIRACCHEWEGYMYFSCLYSLEVMFMLPITTILKEVPQLRYESLRAGTTTTSALIGIEDKFFYSNSRKLEE